jgi:hypothetical protein
MQLPFTAEQFFYVFQVYNTAVWPAQILLNLFAVTAIASLALPDKRYAGGFISLILAILWLWTGLVYHLIFFFPINPAAYLFAAFSVVGAMVFLWDGVALKRLKFEITKSFRSVLGLTFVIYAVLGYPAWLFLLGDRYPKLPTFGLPCQTTLFTIGALFLAKRPFPLRVFIVPIIWSSIGVQAAFQFNLLPDLVLGAAGVFATLYIARVWFNQNVVNWGSTLSEYSMRITGEEFLRNPQIESTHAININSRPEQVWPWLVQMGEGRGGFYSYSWLENLVGCKIENAVQILPRFQNLKRNDFISLHSKAPKLKVTVFDVNRTLAFEGWIFHLEKIEKNRTRLISRIYRERKPEMGLLYNFIMKSALFDFAHFIMSRKQLLTIKRLCKGKSVQISRM